MQVEEHGREPTGASSAPATLKLRRGSRGVRLGTRRVVPAQEPDEVSADSSFKHGLDSRKEFKADRGATPTGPLPLRPSRVSRFRQAGRLGAVTASPEPGAGVLPAAPGLCAAQGGAPAHAYPLFVVQ